MVERSLGSVLPEASIAILDQSFAVDHFEAKSIDLSMSEPMILPFGEYNHRPSGWVELSTIIGSKSATGYGEGATLPEPLFTDDSGAAIAPAMRELVEAIQSHSSTVADALALNQSFMFEGASYPTARLAVEMALLDATTKANSIPVADFIGLPEDIVSVPYGKSIGGSSTQSVVSQAETALGLNAKKIKIKVSPSSFSYVLEAIGVIRSQHPYVELMVDANGSFDPTDEEHLGMIRQLDASGLIMIEEPVSRVGEVRGLEAVTLMRKKLPSLQTLICLDDCLKTYDDCYASLEDGTADIINIKPGRIGSFLKSLKLVDVAQSLDKQVMVGGMLEASPGRHMTSLLGAYCLSKGFTIAGDLSLAQERLSSDLVTNDKQLMLTEDGEIGLVRTTGWGF